MILNRVTPLLEQHLIKEQGGFYPGKSCTSQLLNLTQYIKDTAYKRWSCHGGYKLCQNLLSPAIGVQFTVFFWQAGHVNPLDGWRCSSYKWVMSRQIHVRQPHTNKSGFAISAINKYMTGSRYRHGATGWNTVHLGCTGIRLAQYADT